MKLVFHGGKCCGIRHIYGMGEDPDKVMGDETFEHYHDDEDQTGHDVRSDLSFFVGECPEETRADRLDRFVAYCREHRPRGIIEIVLARSSDPEDEYDQTLLWRPELEKRGFKEVNSCWNSNSGNYIHVFHLNC